MTGRHPGVASVNATTTLPSTRLRGDLTLVACAAFCTTFTQHTSLGRLPTISVLRDGLNLDKEQVAVFLFWASAAWYLKPFVGLLTDSYSLLGTRRRHYLILGALLAASGWAGMATLSYSYTPFLAATVAMNLALVFPSTVLGALMVESGRTHAASGRLASARQVAQSTAAILAPILGGLLAGHWYGVTAGLAAAALLLLAAVAAVNLRESPTAPATTPRTLVLRGLRTRPLWAAAGMQLLVHLSPGFHTSLVFVQRDVFGFSNEYIGLLSGLEGAAGLVAAIAYARICRRLVLRTSIAGTLVLAILATLLLVTYGATTAPFLHLLGAFFGVLAELALMDLALRSTPAGNEALGFALMMSVRNLASAASDVLGASLMERFQLDFSTVVVLNATATLGALLFIPVLPSAIVGKRE